MDINITVAQDIRKARTKDIPGGSVIKNPPCKAGDAVQALVQRLRSHVPWPNKYTFLKRKKSKNIKYFPCCHLSKE